MAKSAETVEPVEPGASSDPLTAQAQRKRAAVEALGELDLALLGLLALFNDSLSRSAWRELAERHGVKTTRGLAVSGPRMRATIVRLDEAELIEDPSPFGSPEYQTPTSVALAVIEELHARGRLRRLLGRPGHHYSWSYKSRLMSELRVALIEGEAQAVKEVFGKSRSVVSRPELGPWLCETLGLAPSPRLVAGLPDKARAVYFIELLGFVRTHLLPLPEAQLEQALAHDDKKVRLELGRLLVLRGEGERVGELGRLPKHGAEGLSLLAAFWAGDYAGAARLGAEAVAAMTRRKRKLLPDLEGVCHVLACLASSGSDPRALQGIEGVIEAGASQGRFEAEPFLILGGLHRALLGERSNVRAHARQSSMNTGWVVPLVAALHDVWLGVDEEPRESWRAGQRGKAVELLAVLAEAAQASGYPPVARELDALTRQLAGVETRGAAPSLAAAFRAPEAWETALIGLDAIVAGAEEAPGAAGEFQPHLVWELKLRAGFGELTPRLRDTPRARKGNVSSLRKLMSGEHDAIMSEDDRQILAAAEPAEYGYSRGGDLVLGARALVASIGHPRVVDGAGKALRVDRGQVTLRTRSGRGRGRVTVELEPAALAEQPVYCEQKGERVTVYERTPELERAAEILCRGLEVPEEGVERLRRTLGRLSVAVGVEVEGDVRPDAEGVEADPRPVLLLEWDGERLGAQARVAPLGLSCAQLRPGVGNRVVVGELREGGELRLLRCERDLDEEKRRLAGLEQACPALVSYARNPLDWRVTELADALEVMLELQRLGDAVVLAWPQGRRLGPPLERGLHNLQLAVSSGKDWLSVDASLHLDESAVLSYRELIEARAGPRFVKLGEDRFVALSEQLRRRLDALANVATRKGAGLRVAPVMLPVLEELAADLDAPEFDAKARAKLGKIRKLADTTPRRPRGFEATLRDYQKDGYAWMWRLAEAGLGACLADDMGLGKTVQALALLSQRARKGPALVVCPTSVVSNWIAETERFAPGLRPSSLAEAGDRAGALEQLRPRAVLVCSYGVLATEAEALAGVEFATVVFDEAHALKNATTKRARAARELRAGFRLGLTGTPVENRVDELWSLFRVLVPGLLGSKAKFEERFARAIARGDRERAGQLRALLRHFILRRTKAQVLDELPARTEVTLRVTPSAEERAYYEALRQKAVEAVEEGDPRKKRFRILAQITRLRQAAVDPRLVEADAAPAGAKIDALVEQLLALREEGHRALVFTQFLGSMALVRARLDAAGVEYLELDGSTSAAERGRRVEAFQAGEGDVFLLSLRAGGVGMNLTGADYVLHLDPWWNPAVEDQATDRAHRIGQTRPVTMYRLITEGTIEDKILGLHARKRELADDILTGLEGAGALDLDELMGLLAG